MNLESVLYYFTHHSESIIQWLFLAILLLSAVVIARTIFGRKEAEATGGLGAAFADGSDIQAFLKKILDQTQKLETVKLDGLSPAAVGEVDAQVQALKKDLAAREEELKSLKAAGPAAAAPAADADKLSTRIKELETKLAEYEILEDDIADLSLYKEENVRLRTELDKLKGGGAVAPAPAAPIAPPAPAGDDIVAEFAQAVTADPAVGASELQLPDTGNPMVDFESAVNLEKKLQGIEAPPQAPAAPTPPPTPAPVAAAPAAPTPAPAPAAAAASPAVEAEGDDLFAEFTTAPPEHTEGGGSLDTDKMMEEMAALVSMEPAKGSALHEEIDTEKMAAEATKLVKP